MLGKPSLNTGSIEAPSLEEKLRIAHEAGYPAVGIFEKDLLDYFNEDGDLHKIAALLEELGLEVSEVMAFRGWVTHQPVTRRELLERNTGVLRACEILGCNVATAPASGADIEAERYIENFRAACEVAAEYSITLAFEFLGKLRVARDLATGLKIVEGIELPNAKLLIDTAHFLAGGSSMDDLMKTAVERIALIHFEDIAPGSQDTTGEKDRMIPGEGAAPLKKIVQILQHKGYRGYYSMELFGERYRTSDPLEVAQRGCQGTRRLLEESEV